MQFEFLNMFHTLCVLIVIFAFLLWVKRDSKMVPNLSYKHIVYVLLGVMLLASTSWFTFTVAEEQNQVAYEMVLDTSDNQLEDYLDSKIDTGPTDGERLAEEVRIQREINSKLEGL